MFSMTTVDFIDQNPDGQAPITQRHDVDGLPAPKGPRRQVSNAKGMVVTDDQRAAPIPQEQQDHEASEQRAEQAFSHNRQQEFRTYEDWSNS